MVQKQRRSLSPEELYASAERNVRRLIRGVHEMDADQSEAVLEVASVLRQLVARGQGNRLLQRLGESDITRFPRMAKVDRGLESPCPGVRFHLAGLPLELVTEATATGPSLDEFLESWCLRISSQRLMEEVTYKWEGLIKVIADKLGGVHTDEKREEILDDLACYIVAGVPVLRYALRTVGAAVASAACVQLESEDLDRMDLPPLFRPNSTELYGACVIGDLDQGPFEFRADCNVVTGMDQEVLGWEQRGDPEWLFSPPEDAARNIQVRSLLKVGRNDPCPCGSGMKYKRCCI